MKDATKILRSADDLVEFFLQDLANLKTNGLNRLDDSLSLFFSDRWSRHELCFMGAFSMTIITPLFMFLKGIPGNCNILVVMEITEFRNFMQG